MPAPNEDTQPPPPDELMLEAALMSPQTLTGNRQLVLRVMPLPADVNANGDIFGGWIMAQVDLAGAVLPARVAKGRIATVAVKEFVFKQPVSLGDLLSFYARIVRIGTTSVTVHVEVYAERNPANPHVVKVTEATLTYVAIDAKGQPRPLPR
jgi:acyl-CoA thioesterase YciA